MGHKRARSGTNPGAPLKNAITWGALAATLVILPATVAIFSVDRAHVTLEDRMAMAEGPVDAEAVFDRLGFNASDPDLGNTVPRVLRADLPRELPHINDVNDRKALFLSTVLPHVLQVNEIIEAERETLRDIIEKRNAGRTLARQEKAWMGKLAKKYRTDEDDYDRLVRRVNIIPPSLALAQAAIESGWGTSRFAQEGNAIYGQWTWGDDGMVPLGRPEGASYRVRTFSHLIESVASYARNLNTHPAYEQLRRVRAELTRKDQPVVGTALAPTLTQYSTRREAYVQDLRSIMRSNRLTRFDHVRLEYSARPHTGDGQRIASLSTD